MNMRRVARYYSVFMSIPFIGAVVMSIPAAMKVGVIVLLKGIGISVASIPLVLAVIVLGPSKHRWERYALICNQALAIVTALAFAWAALTPKEQAGVYGMVLLASVLNWAAMADRERTKTLVFAGFGIWALAFILLAASVDPEARHKLTAASAGWNVVVFYILGIAVLTLGSIKLHGLLTKPKDAPLSKAHREGDMAFRNAFGEDTNPYAGGDPQLAESWLSGYRKASKAKASKM